MNARLTIQPSGGSSYPLEVANTATIGRSSENTIAFPKDPHVSRQHALIRSQNGVAYQIIDLGSRNGTFVDGVQVILPQTLKNGAKIRIGENEITFTLPETEECLEEAGTTMTVTIAEQSSRMLTAALLVCDIRGFSTYSEKLAPAQIAQCVGQWFRTAGAAVAEHGGVIDKFIGDAILAYWIDSEHQACQSALACARTLLSKAPTQLWPAFNEPLRIGIALHYGSVSSGNIGIIAQRDATIIGDTVNTAFRLEGVMKETGQDLICSEAFQAECLESASFVDLGEHALKGKSNKVRVFGLKS